MFPSSILQSRGGTREDSWQGPLKDHFDSTCCQITAQVKNTTDLNGNTGISPHTKKPVSDASDDIRWFQRHQNAGSNNWGSCIDATPYSLFTWCSHKSQHVCIITPKLMIWVRWCIIDRRSHFLTFCQSLQCHLLQRPFTTGRQHGTEHDEGTVVTSGSTIQEQLTAVEELMTRHLRQTERMVHGSYPGCSLKEPKEHPGWRLPQGNIIKFRVHRKSKLDTQSNFEAQPWCSVGFLFIFNPPGPPPFKTCWNYMAIRSYTSLSAKSTGFSHTELQSNHFGHPNMSCDMIPSYTLIL